MKTSFSIFLIFLSLVFSNSSSLFAQMNPEEINKAEEALGFSGRLSFPSNTSILTTAQRVSSIEGESSISALVAEQEDIPENSIKIVTQEDSFNCNVLEGNNSDFQGNIKSDDSENILSVIEPDKNFNLKSCVGKQKMNGRNNEIKKKALSICCQKWLTETLPPQILSDYNMSFCKYTEDHKLDYSLIKTFEEYWNKIAKAHDLGNDLLALSLIQVAEDVWQAIKDSIELPKVFKDEDMPLYCILPSWRSGCYDINKLAKYREKYILAKDSSQVPEIVSNCKKIIEKLRSSIKYKRNYIEHEKIKLLFKSLLEDDYNFMTSMLTEVLQLEDKPLAFALIQKIKEIQQCIGDMIQESENKEIGCLDDYYFKKSYCLRVCKEQYTQVKKSSQSSEIIDNWKKIIEKLNFSDKYCGQLRKIVQEYDLEDRGLSVFSYFDDSEFMPTSDRILVDIMHLECIIGCFEKSNNAVAKGELEVAELWQKLAESCQKSIEITERCELYYSEKEAKKLHELEIYHSCSSLRASSDQLENSSTELEKVIESQRKLRGLEIYHSYSPLRSSANQLKNASNALEKVIEAKKINKGELGELWLKTVKQYEESAQYYQQSAEAYLLGNEEEGNRLGTGRNDQEGLGYVAEKVADSLKKQAEVFEKSCDY
ncbi:MAG TPA: hypothetical protein VJK54_07290 [Chthoniobacterales bacterium]|nr:hypothetical protein [Chthoniobacterales bacterium]